MASSVERAVCDDCSSRQNVLPDTSDGANVALCLMICAPWQTRLCTTQPSQCSQASQWSQATLYQRNSPFEENRQELSKPEHPYLWGVLIGARHTGTWEDRVYQRLGRACWCAVRKLKPLLRELAGAARKAVLELCVLGDPRVRRRHRFELRCVAVGLDRLA
eukprot:2958834-Pleurochrysis_carterae.AAC.1